ncbi:MAG: hypothetical protein D6690_14755 [Nitrospirae bacterium]|nr:MAG: hypothetical protein D6690_14755 [Nitrospirota bacterium]
MSILFCSFFSNFFDSIDSLSESRLQALRSLAIMSPYRARVRLIRQLAEAAALPASVRVGTIHQFQGQQADLVILDTTIADRLVTSFLCRESETFSAETLLNVALTRGRAKVIGLGSAEAVQALPAETFLKTVFRHLQRDGLIVDVDRFLYPEPADTLHI